MGGIAQFMAFYLLMRSILSRYKFSMYTPFSFFRLITLRSRPVFKLIHPVSGIWVGTAVAIAVGVRISVLSTLVVSEALTVEASIIGGLTGGVV